MRTLLPSLQAPALLIPSIHRFRGSWSDAGACYGVFCSCFLLSVLPFLDGLEAVSTAGDPVRDELEAIDDGKLAGDGEPWAEGVSSESFFL